MWDSTSLSATSAQFNTLAICPYHELPVPLVSVASFRRGKHADAGKPSVGAPPVASTCSKMHAIVIGRNSSLGQHAKSGGVSEFILALVQYC